MTVSPGLGDDALTPHAMPAPHLGYGETYTDEPIDVLDLKHAAAIVTRGDWSAESLVALRPLLRDDVAIIHLAGDETIETRGEAEMLAAGWVRA